MGAPLELPLNRRHAIYSFDVPGIGTGREAESLPAGE